MVALALPGSLLFGPTWGFNFAMLLSFILSGWAMYLWVKHLTDDPMAGLVAGTVFAFLPYRMVHFVVGHLSLAGTQWFPFYFWGLFDLLKQEKFSWKPVLMAGIAAGLIGLTSPYYVYMTILISGVFLLGFIIFKGYKRLKDAVFWKSLLAFGLLAVRTGRAFDATVSQPEFPEWPGLAFGGLPEPLFGQPDGLCHPIDQTVPVGEWIDHTFSPEIFQESTLYIGAVAFVLAVVAWIKRRQFRHPELLDIAILMAAAGFVLSLGIQLHWLGTTTLPQILAAHFSPYGHAHVLPSGLLPVPLPALLFQNAGDDALWAVHADLYEPDGRLGGLPVDEIGLLQSQTLGRDWLAGIGVH